MKKTLKAIICFTALYIAVTLAAIIKIVIDSTEPLSAKILSGCGAAISLFLIVFVYAIYVIAARPKLLEDTKSLAVICCCMAATVVICIYAEMINIYLMPIFLASFLLAPLTKRRNTFTAGLFTVMMVTAILLLEYSVNGEDIFPVVLMFVIGLFSGTLVAFTLSYERKRLGFIIKGLSICAATLVLLLAFAFLGIKSINLRGELTELFPVAQWSAVAIFAQLILTLVLQPVLERAFNLLTNNRLIELTDHNSPLIKRLIAEAPGTFNHSLAVANFAEVCATAIGENPYLARTCAYYHDIGKLTNKTFFKENQSDDNPHDTILPEVSAEIIRSHTTEGLRLCLESRIPIEIADVTIEHHGTMPIPMFYVKAQSLTDSDVNKHDYSYHGKTPTTKISAIIMICDSAEAAIRAMEAAEGDKVEKIVSRIIESRIGDGQFDNCDITLRELNTIKFTIVAAFGGIYHKRLKYPKLA